MMCWLLSRIYYDKTMPQRPFFLNSLLKVMNNNGRKIGVSHQNIRAIYFPIYQGFKTTSFAVYLYCWNSQYTFFFKCTWLIFFHNSNGQHISTTVEFLWEKIEGNCQCILGRSMLEQRRAGCLVKGEYRGIWGYSDDNWAMAPSLSSLQDMIDTMEEYAVSHNLIFSTDPNPVKCKTKCMAYLKRQRVLPNMTLCGTPLPWVDKLKHLGITVTSIIDGCQKDISIKRARYIERSCEILQEFHFTAPLMKMKLHSIYNSHFTGSCCWDMTSQAGKMLEATFNKNIKITYDLPYATHRNLLPVISGAKPLRITLAKRLIAFTERIRNSDKSVLRRILTLVESDARTVTGRNLRSVLLLTDKARINQLQPSDMELVSYYGEPEQWRIVSINEVLQMRAGELELPDGWRKEEMQEILDAACCS